MPARQNAENGRRRPVQERSRATVTAILDAASQLFDRGSATTTAIAERAGVSIGSLYEYFRNKDAVLGALMDRHTRDGEAALLARLDPADAAALSLESGVRGVVDELIGLHADHPALHRLLLSIGMRSPVVRARIADAEARLRTRLEAWLRVHPEVHVPNPAWAARIVVQGSNALVHRHVDNREGLPDDDLAAELTRLWVPYLRGDEPEPPRELS